MVNTVLSHVTLIAGVKLITTMRFFGTINVTLNSTNKRWQQQQFCCVVCLLCINLLCFTSSKEKISETALMLLTITLPPDVLSENLLLSLLLFFDQSDNQSKSMAPSAAESCCLPHAIFWPTKFSLLPSRIVTFTIIHRSKIQILCIPLGLQRHTGVYNKCNFKRPNPKNNPRCVYFTRFALSSGDKSWAWDEWGELFNQVPAWQRASPRCLRTFFLS